MRKINEDLLTIETLRYPTDCRRIAFILYEEGIVVTLNQAQSLWENYSDTLCASWINLPKDDKDILDILTEEV